MIEGLSDIEGLVIRGITDPERLAERVPTVSFTVEGIAPETIVRLMNAENIFLWSGHNYAWRSSTSSVSRPSRASCASALPITTRQPRSRRRWKACTV
ncbi:hypothetical protein ACVOMV_38120 [Mesorhizobium atlanticum]